MAKDNNSIGKVLTVAFSLCLICSIIVSTAAVALRSKQAENQELDRKTNILAVADLLEPGMDVGEEFAKAVTPKAVELATGEYTDEVDATSYDGFTAAKDPAQSRKLTAEQDIAGIGREEKFSTVYLVGDAENPEKIILPIRGQGLWGLMQGYLSVQGDGNTITGITFFSHSETPGLGGEVDNPRWKAKWDGKEIYAADDGDAPAIELVKGGASNPNQVDALSGASLTSRGVTHLVQFWMGAEGFGPYLERFRSGDAGAADESQAAAVTTDETEGA